MTTRKPLVVVKGQVEQLQSGDTIDIGNTTVTPGSYTNTNLTVDANGRLTAASNGSAGGTFKYSLYTLSADQTTNLAANNHIQFNTVSGSLGGLATGSGQANGIITLAGGKTYKITATIICGFSTLTNGYIVLQCYNRTTSTFFGLGCEPINVTNVSNYSSQPLITTFITTSGSTDIDIRFQVVQTFTGILAANTFLLIEEYNGV